MKQSLRYLVVAALMLTAWAYMRTHRDKPTPLPIPFKEFPMSIGDWKLAMDSVFDRRVLEVLRPTDYMAKRFVKPDGSVADLYVGYHDGASQAGPLHSPKNCLPGSGWYEVSSQRTRLGLKGGKVDAVIAVYRQGSSSELFLYWFQVAGRTLNAEHTLKINEILNSALNGRHDTSFIRISVPVTGSTDKAAAEARDFLEAVYPSLKQFLPS